MNILLFTAVAFINVLSCHARRNVFEMNIERDILAKVSKNTYKPEGRDFSFASYYQDGMVLQGSPQSAVVWGYVPSNHENNTVEVHVNPGNKKYTAVTRNDLTWRMEIGPVEAGGPYDIVAHLLNNSVQLKGVLFGDVWICSGQSNMHFPLTQIFNSTEEVKDTAHFQNIRLFVTNYAVSETPLVDLKNDGILLPWSKPSPETVVKGNFSAVCWLYGKYLYKQLNKPIGLLETSVGGTPIEAWSSKDALKKCGLKQQNSKEVVQEALYGETVLYDNSVLWNAMVHPFINMTIYGTVWYQGESNSGQHTNRDLYNCTFPAMIDDWRKKFSMSGGTSQLFPFGFVQLAGDVPDFSMAVGFPDIRWHQTADYGYVPNHRQRNVFMAVTMDLPDFTSPYGQVHTRDKQDVAARLVLGSLATAYKQNVSFHGPYPVKVTITRAELPYTYTQVEIEYTMDLEQRWLDGFEICCAFVKPAVCETGKAWWLPTATWQGYDRDNVTQSYVSECSIEDVVGIRYAWRQSPCPFKKCAIYGAKNGLPMPPFTYHGEAFNKRLIGKDKYIVKLEHTEANCSVGYIPEIIVDKGVILEVDDVKPTPEYTQRNFSFASYYGDNMVLQATPKKAVIWGYAPSFSNGSTVELRISPGNMTHTTTVTDDLLWAVQIGPMKAGGPYIIEAILGSSKIVLNDVLFGDVWVCSGQSNMQFSMSQIFNSTAELNDTVNYPDIRVFVVKDKTSNVPLTDLSSDGILMPWSKPSPETLGQGPFHAFSAVCWLYGKYLYQHLKKPIGLFETSWGGTPVEAWSSPDALKKCGLEHNGDVTFSASLEGPQENTVLWNAMVHPILNMTIYGAIWYQGENNAKYHTDLYKCTFPAMIDDWRKKFSISGGTDKLFPFGFVQLAENRPDSTIDFGFPDIRWHQTADYGYVPNHRLRNVFMAVAMDLPDFTSPWGSIHPRDKQDVAHRLVLSGLAVGYSQEVSYQGPYPVKVSVTLSSSNYTQVDVEYTMNLEQRWLDGFEICCAYTSPAVCEEGKSWWLPTTTIQRVDTANTTRSYTSECSIDNLVGLRYAWKESPCPFKNCAIYGADNGLPMPPFTYSGKAFRKIFINRDRYEVLLNK